MLAWPEDLSSNPQKLGAVISLQNSSDPAASGEAEIGQSLEAHRSPVLYAAAVNNKKTPS